MVRVKASPAFALPGSGFQLSTTCKFRALMTEPRFSAPGGSFVTNLIGAVVTDAATES